MNVTDWLIGVSALATLALAVAAFVSIKASRRSQLEERHKERQRQALERIRGWAEVISALLAQPSLQPSLQRRLKELDSWLQSTAGKCLGVLSDAEQLGGDLNSYVKLAHITILSFVARLRSEEEIARHKTEYKIEDELKLIGSIEELQEAKREVVYALNDVINSVTVRLLPPQ